MQDSNLTDKHFKFTMPLTKGYEGQDGYYHVAFQLSTTDRDLQDDEMTQNAIDTMVEEAKHIAINGNHDHGLKELIGPVTKAWKDENHNLWVDTKVRKNWEDDIRDLVKSGTPLGGSIEGKATKTIVEDGKTKIDAVKLYGGALTDIPANWNTRGSAQEVKGGCPGSMCSQIMKSLDIPIVKGWDGSASNYTDEQYKKACLYCDPKVGTGNMTIKSGCKLPVRTPNGVLDEGGVKSAYAAMQGARNSPDIPKEAKSKIMNKLKDYYKELGLTDLGPLKTDKSKNLEVNTMTEEIKDDNLDKTVKETIIGVFKSLIPKEEPKIEEPVIEKKVELELEKAKKGAVCPECGAAIDCDGDNDVSKTVDIEIKKTLEDKDTLIKSLEDKLAEKDTKLIEKEHSELVTKALELTKKVDKKTEIKDEKGLIKHLKSLDVDVETDLDKSIESYSQGLKMALKTIPQGDLPNIVDKTVTKEKKTISDKEFEKTLELMKKIENKGKQEE